MTSVTPVPVAGGPAQRTALKKRSHGPTRRDWLQMLLFAVAALAFWMFLAPSQIGGPLTYAVVHGHSMEPSLHDGDLVVAVRQSSYEVGDTVLYDKFGGLVIHELVSGDPVNGWVSRGVNNTWDDAWRVMPGDIKGTYLFSSTTLGSALGWLVERPQAAALAAVLVFVILSLPRPHRRTLTPQARLLMKQSRCERCGNTALLTILCTVMVGLAIAAATVLLIRGQTAGTSWTIAVVGVVAACTATAIVAALCRPPDQEPEHSKAILDGHLRRLPPDVPIDGIPLGVRSATDLLAQSEHWHTPVFHQHLPDRDVFTAVTPVGNPTWAVRRG